LWEKERKPVRNSGKIREAIFSEEGDSRGCAVNVSLTYKAEGNESNRGVRVGEKSPFLKGNYEGA